VTAWATHIWYNMTRLRIIYEHISECMTQRIRKTSAIKNDRCKYWHYSTPLQKNPSLAYLSVLITWVHHIWFNVTYKVLFSFIKASSLSFMKIVLKNRRTEYSYHIITIIKKVLILVKWKFRGGTRLNFAFDLHASICLPE
jgi:hypothetical protein